MNRFVNIVFVLLLALPIWAQDDSVSYVLEDTLSAVVVPTPVIEYTMQRKTYEIADIKVTGKVHTMARGQNPSR